MINRGPGLCYTFFITLTKKMRHTKLIVLRGPSGSGKSTVAEKLFQKAKRKVCLIEQDHYRYIFNPAGGGSKHNSDAIHKMIKNDVLIALNGGYDVLLEGILSVSAYGKVLDEIFTKHPNKNYMFYFDVSFKETVRRYHTKPKSIRKNFSEKDMRKWYPYAHRSSHKLERIIPETYSIEETTRYISKVSRF